MGPENQQYVVEDEIAAFFSKTSVPRESCDALARELMDGDLVIPVAVQGACSYTVYAGQGLGHVVQFRLKSLGLKAGTAALARLVFDTLAPDVSFKQQLGEDFTTAGREPLLVYVMTRIRGISYLDFKRFHRSPENLPERKAYRKNLMQDVARFFALAWKAPQEVGRADRDRITRIFQKELHMLLVALPDRLHPIIRTTLASLPSIFSLPIVLLHKDFGDCNIIVEEESCHLSLMSKLDLRKGRIRYEDYDDLARLFWENLSDEVGGLGDDTARSIKAAMVLGLLRSRGFTSRLANEPKAVPIRDDDSGRYYMMILDGLLLNPATRFEGLDEWLDGMETERE
ncbi:hypothetical protein HYQ45_006421 [Verticillium longisporum]|uniref:Aminoglycoside phosphotransferase domain-containing protein n=1 Tax=Verticillium longisporum TaxID=100787 RepID=A0A0G4LN37_VERLO|nr:hypothetical protein HYQ44_016194 [Verticillium longisporum]KAG7135965.1 hypothetical protein HYQ45_006421 [Verticillium longisporum]KAG7151681.1 hypothetical protein HYQ46_012520 [Verticillium longisporum]CRK19066.1 hypothetical protein BN1708_012519 [Verticillium longisporum]CRK23457.1 hypothetical protein BN1723_012970 [Verticillium longisporum]